MKSGNRQLKVLVDTHLASEFKTACRESGVSMAKELSGYMEERLGMAKKKHLQVKSAKIATRRDRRGAIRSIVSMLVATRDAEEAYLEAIPENLRGGPAYENAECAICAMDDAIELLNEVYG